MSGKCSSTALLGTAVLCALILVACNNGPSLHFVTVTPASGTVYFFAGAGGGVKGARAGADATRKGAEVVSPQDITNASCRSQQFAATAFFSDGSSKDETNSVQWSSSNTSVASISQSGKASGFALGTSSIGATFNTVAATPATLEVDQLNSISMMPPSANIASVGSQQFVANGNFTLASGSAAQQPIVATQLTWMSSNTNLVTVDANGNATSTGNGSGQVTITATTCDGAQGKATVTVGAPAVTLVITPLMPTIAAGTTIQFSALTHSDNSPVLNPVTWQSVSTNVATINATSGLALGVAGGSSTTIMATETEGTTTFTGSATLNVNAPAARYAYAGNLASQNISSYTVNVANGTFAPLATFNTSAPGPRQVLLHPSGDFLYFIDDGCSLHSVFIDSTSGALAKTQQSVQATSAPATCVGAIDPLGRFIYVLSAENNAIFGFSITQATAQSGKTGPMVAGLSPISGFAAPSAPNGYTDGTLNFPDWILIDPTGSFLYVVNNTNNLAAGSISQYSINADGTLSPLSPATVPAGNGTTNAPFYGCIDRNGNLFVANLGNNLGDPETVSGYKIGAGGQLSSLGPDVTTGAATAINVITSPVASYMYVLDADSSGNGQVFAYTYTIGASTFTLTAVGSPTPTGNSPDGMAIDPTGNLLAIDNTAFNPAPTGSISLYTITQSGASAGGLTAANGGNPAPAGTSTHFISYYTALSGQ